MNAMHEKEADACDEENRVYDDGIRKVGYCVVVNAPVPSPNQRNNCTMTSC